MHACMENGRYILPPPFGYERFNDPKLGKIKLVGQAMKLSRTPSKLKTAAPQKGEHTKDILTELGYSDDEINNLKMENAI